VAVVIAVELSGPNRRPVRCSTHLALVTTATLAAFAAFAAPLAGAPEERRGPGCPRAPIVSAADPVGNVPELRSENGRLDVTLRMGPGRARMGTRTARGWLYEGGLPGPVLRVCPGDLLRVRIVNRLPQPTNLHVHGLHVSPLGRGDNVLREVPPGASAQYEYRIPRDHPGGVNWYHPHRHELTDPQVYKGLAGMLVVDDRRLDDLPGLRGVPERLQDQQAIQLDGDVVADRSKVSDLRQRVLVNGRLRPTFRVRPGELQRWRLVNASADASVRLRLRGGGELTAIATDGNTLARPQRHGTFYLGPGQRVELLVRGPARGRRVTLETTRFRQPFENTIRQALVTMVGSGPAARPARAPRRLLAFRDLSRLRVDRRRTVTFESDFPRFLVNGRQFDHHRVDQVLRLGRLEEWRIVNRSNEWHSFHLHQDPVQVVAWGRRPARRIGYQDTVPIPPRETVTVRIRPRDFTGLRVFHCHLLGHEDGGMMSLVDVTR
jgi:suppressor of ftsI